MIEFRCKSCGKLRSAEESAAGQSTACEHCNAKMETPFPPLELPQEITAGGSVVHRHEPGMRDREPTQGSDSNIERISQHIEEHIGEIEGVWHEIVSDLVHIDIHSVAPTEDRPFRTLVTSGMSDLAMTTPDDATEYQFLELMICLPDDWPVSEKAFADENNYWPARWLKRLARFPHEYDTWLFYGHTLPNGEPPKPFAENNHFTGWLLMPPRLAPDMFQELEVDEDRTIHFAALFPLFEEEMQLKLEFGTEVLFERMVRNKVTELLDIHRENVALSDYGSLD